jgi:hypothetical protein
MSKQGIMQKGIGVICLVVGLWLLLRGHDVANSIGSQFTRAFTGAPMGEATRYYLAGGAVGLFGGFLFFLEAEIKFNFPPLPAALCRR